MKNKFIFVFAALLLFLGSFSVVHALTPFFSNQLANTPSNGLVLQTDGLNSHWVATSTLGFTGGGNTNPGGSSGQLQYNASGAFGGVSTSTLTASSPLTGSFTHVGTTGSLGCQTASGSQAGCLSSVDWTTFNGKGSGSVTSIATNNGLTGGTITTTGTLGLATINAGVLGATTNGSVPTSQATSSLYGIGTNGFTLAEVAGVPMWTATTTFSSPLLYSAGNVTCQTASGSNNGCLSSTDWNTFNSKVSFAWPFIPATSWAINTSATTTALWGQNGVFASSTSATVPAISASNTIGPAAIFGTGNVGIGSTTVSTFSNTADILDVSGGPVGVNIGNNPVGLYIQRSNASAGNTTIAINDCGRSNCSAPQAVWYFGASQNGSFGVRLNNSILDTSPAFTIASTAGNPVGIGTSSPYAALSIGGGNLVLGAAAAGGTPGDLFLPKLGTAAGSFLAVDPTGKVIATTTPTGGVTSIQQTYGTAQTGAITLATTSASFNGLTVADAVTNSGGTFTIAPLWSGTLNNAGLTNSTISGVALGGSLFSHTHDSTLNGTSYNGSAAVSDWGLNLTNPNTWTGLQQFNGNASTTQLTVTGNTYLATASGQVGVGTTTPSKLFTVEGNQTGGIARIQRDIPSPAANTIYGTYDVVANEIGGLQDGSGPAQTFGVMNSGGSENLYGEVYTTRAGADTTGNMTLDSYTTGSPNSLGTLTLSGVTNGVVVGSTTPSNNSNYCLSWGFCVTGVSNPGIKLVSSQVTPIQLALEAQSSPSNVALLGTISNDPVSILTNNVQRLTVASGGSVGIGTTTPPYALEIASSSGQQLVLSDTSTADNQWAFRNAGGTLYIGTTSPVTYATSTPSGVQISSSATTAFGIGTTTPWRTLSVTGTVGFDGLSAAAGTVQGVCFNSVTKELEINTLTNCTVSSARYKHDIQYLSPNSNGLPVIDKLKPASFIYNGNTYVEDGFIAEDVASVAHQLAGYDKQGLPSAVDDIGIDAQLVLAVQQLQKEIKTPNVEKSFEDEWQWVAIGLLCLYVAYNEWDKRK